jgi:hypothetical protein
MIDVTVALHASAPSGHKCADCSIDGVPCPTCYAAWWPTRLTGPRGSAMRQFNEQRDAAIKRVTDS